MRKLLKIIFLFIIIYTASYSKENIFILNSYGQDFEWTAAQVEGILKETKKSFPLAAIIVEYMDWKKNNGDEYYNFLKEQYKYKYKKFHPDIIIVTDNIALKMANEIREEIFQNEKIPIVFSGINDFQFAKTESGNDSCGFIEILSIEENIQMITSIHKNSNIYVLNDNSETGKEIRKEIEKAAEKNGLKDYLFYIGLNSVEQIKNDLKKAGEKAVFIQGATNLFEDGTKMEYDEFLKIIKDNSSRPVYSFWSFLLGKGIVGGKLLSGEKYGEMAGSSAVRILKGEKPEIIGIVEADINVLMFDEKELKKYKIPRSFVSKEAVIVNKSDSFLEKNREILIKIIFIFLGMAAMIIFLIIDIIKRKKIEKSLTASERVYKLVINNLPQQIFYKNRDFVYLSCNENYAKTLGISVDDVAGKTDYFFYDEKRAEKYREEDMNTLLKEKSIRYEEEIENKGKLEIHDKIKVPVKDENGEIVGIIGVIDDLTEEKKKQEQIEKERAIFYSAVEQSLAGIIVISAFDESFIVKNRAAEEMLGDIKSLKELYKENRAIVFYDEYGRELSYFDIFISKTLKKGELYVNYKLKMINNNSEKWLLINSVPVYDKTIDIIAAVVIINDISTEHEQQQKIMELNGKLELKIKELEEVIQKVEESSKAKTMFLANMSHEIRTPLNGIMGMIQLLSCTDINEEQKSYIKNMEFSSELLLSIISDILDFAKIEYGKVQIEKSIFNIEETITGIISTFTAALKSKNVEIVYYKENSIPDFVIGDAAKIRQLLVNIIGNAVKFTEKGEIVVSVRNIEETEEKIKLEFSISDTGIGIEDEQQEKIFETFFQADSSYQKKYQGTGLGLAICKRLIEFMGGNIYVESKLGEGSRFWFTLWLEKSSMKNETETVEFLKGKKVLAAIENAFTLETTCKLIEEAGGIAISFHNFESAELELKNVGEYDLIVIDYKLENTSSREFIEILRNNIGDKNTPVILLVSTEQIGVIKEFGNSINREILKPLNKKEFYQVAGEVIKNSHRLDEEIVIQKEKSKYELESQKKYIKAKILIADDNYLNLTTMGILLKKNGYEIVEAKNGEECVARAVSESPDLILMDIQMPGKDGYEAAQEIRAKGINIPIIALTAYAMKESIEKAKKSGMDGYLLKPIGKKDLYDEVESKLKEYRKNILN